jgi:hypothetical protein
VLLQRHFYGHQVGRLVITDDRGVRSGRPFAGKRRATLVNRGVIVKRKATGISTIGTLYVAGRVVARSGHVVVPGQAVAPQTATSPPVTTCPPFLPCTCRRLEGCTDDQSAVLKLPASDTDGPGTTTVEPLAGEQVKGAVGVPMQVHASDLDATLADPAVIQLRYDVALFTDAGEPADPTTVSVGHADGANQPYDDVPACAGNAIPLGAFACIDHTASRIVSGTLVAVIRTTDTSRWIIH